MQLPRRRSENAEPQPEAIRSQPGWWTRIPDRECDMEEFAVFGHGGDRGRQHDPLGRGVGVHAARLLQGDSRVPAGVTILDGGTIGLELIPYASDASRVLLLDALNSGEAPGTLARMTGKDLLGTTGGWSAHQLGVADLIAALFLVSTHPQDIVVLGVQPANTDWGTALSPEVEAALVPLVDAALDAARCVGRNRRRLVW